MIERIQLLEEVRWLASEWAKTGTGKRSTSPAVLKRAVAMVERQYGKEMAEAAQAHIFG